MRILFHPATPVNVLTMLDIVNAFKAKGSQAELQAYHLDDWYCFSVPAYLAANDIKFSGFSREFDSNKPTWQLEDGGASLFKTLYPKFIESFRQALEAYRPHVFVIFGDDGIFEAGMLRICRSAQVPTVFVQEGPVPEVWQQPKSDLDSASKMLSKKLVGLLSRLRKISSSIRRLKQSTPANTQHRAVHLPPVRHFGLNGSDVIAALNSKDCNWFKKHKIETSYVNVTGSVLMDRLWHFVMKHTTSAISPEGPLGVLVISSGLAHLGRCKRHNWYVEQIRILRSLLSPGEMSLSLRLKPGEKLEDWSGLWDNIEGSLQVIPSQADLFSQILDAEVLVVINSQVMVEAVMIGKPVVNLEPAGMDVPFALGELIERGVVYESGSGSELAQLLRTGRDSLRLDNVQLEQRDLCFEELYYRFDGNAALRVSKAIEKALEIYR